MEPKTPAFSINNNSLCKTEDSGYQTSLTPGSIDCSELSNENLDPSILKTLCTNEVTPDDKEIKCEAKLVCCSKHRNFRSTPIRPDIDQSISYKRKSLKRSFKNVENVVSVPTPTTAIAGGIQSLNFSDSCGSSKISRRYSYDQCHQIIFEDSILLTCYPTTPVKNTSVNDNTSLTLNKSCQSSPLRSIDNLLGVQKRSAKKLIFNSEDTEEKETFSHSRVLRLGLSADSYPEQKIDIIKMLCIEHCCPPALINIFSHLSNKDIYNYSLVSPIWQQVCDNVPKAKFRKEQYEEFINNTKENHENRLNKNKTKEVNNSSNLREKLSEGSLKDIQNTLNIHNVKMSPKRSPPTTPSTKRFKKFFKSASLDSRPQLSCSRCRQPAKVIEDNSGEEWVQCTSTICMYQFCRYCKCDRHSSKMCFKKYDLESISPSKRKIRACGIGTRRSKMQLRRL